MMMTGEERNASLADVYRHLRNAAEFAPMAAPWYLAKRAAPATGAAKSMATTKETRNRILKAAAVHSPWAINYQSPKRPSEKEATPTLPEKVY